MSSKHLVWRFAIVLFLLGILMDLTLLSQPVHILISFIAGIFAIILLCMNSVYDTLRESLNSPTEIFIVNVCTAYTLFYPSLFFFVMYLERISGLNLKGNLDGWFAQFLYPWGGYFFLVIQLIAILMLVYSFFKNTD